MRKYVKNIFLSVLVLSTFLLPFVSNAATIGMAPSNVRVHVGDTFKINLTASGKGSNNYTVQINARFTPKVIGLSSWVWQGNGNLIPLKTSGFDSFDNTAGTLVRTTGYAGGFSGLVNLADATFMAKSVGQATITITPDSFTYDESGTNTYVQGSNTYVNVEVLPAVKKPAKVTPPKVVEIQPIPTPTPEPEIVTKIVKVEVPVPTPADSELELFNLNNLIFLIVGIILGLLLLKLFETLGPPED